MADQASYKPGQIVAITQQVPKREKTWTSNLRGKVIRYEQKPTGAWYAHSRNGILWLDRLLIEKEDGELVACILDQYSQVRILAEPENAASDAPAADMADEPKDPVTEGEAA
jgi:hypothetical protein